MIRPMTAIVPQQNHQTRSMPGRRFAARFGVQHRRRTALLVLICLLSVPAVCAENPPTAEDIATLREETQTVVARFMTGTFRIRMQYAYSGRFLSAREREQLQFSAIEAQAALANIAESQRKTRALIEQYEGEDWDVLYGETGLWRRLSGDIYVTAASRCEIGLYEALAADEDDRQAIAERIAQDVRELDETYDTALLDLLRARTMAAAGADQRHVREALAEAEGHPDVRPVTAFRAAIEQVRLSGPTSTQEFDGLLEQLQGSELADDTELLLSLTFVLRHHGNTDALANVLSRRSELPDVFGQLALADLTHMLEQNAFEIEEIAPIEADLACVAMLKKMTATRAELAKRLAESERLRSAATLYACGATMAETEPARACQLLVEAGRIQREQPNQWLGLTGETIVRESMEVAQRCFAAQGCEPELVVETVEQGQMMLEGPVDLHVQYTYSLALMEAGQREKGMEVLAGLAKSEETGTPESLRSTILTTYSQLLIAEEADAQMQGVVALLNEKKIESDPNLCVWRSLALQRMGKASEAIRSMTAIEQAGLCEHAATALGLLAEVVGQIERYDLSDKEMNTLGTDGVRLARFCYRCLNGAEKRLAALYAAEAQVLGNSSDAEKLLGARRFLDEFVGRESRDFEAVRCRARLAMAQYEYMDAAADWRRLASAHERSGRIDGENSWLWWRAKYYELLCCAESGRIDQSQLLHTINVLQAVGDLPTPWKARFSELAGRLRSGGR